MPLNDLRHMLPSLHFPSVLLDIVLNPRDILGRIHMYTQVKQRLLPRWALNQERPGRQGLQRLKAFHWRFTEVGRCQIADPRTRVDNADFGYCPRRDSKGRSSGRHDRFCEQSRFAGPKDDNEDQSIVANIKDQSAIR